MFKRTYVAVVRFFELTEFQIWYQYGVKSNSHLWNNREPLPKVVQADCGSVDTINCDGAFQIRQSKQGLYNRGFACASSSHYTYLQRYTVCLYFI